MSADAAAHHTSTGLSNVKLGMWLFLGSECLLFGGLISTYMLYRGRVGEGPTPSQVFDIPFTSVSSFVLLMSSLTMVLAVSAAHKNDDRSMRLWLAVTALLGATFVGGQVYTDSIVFKSFDGTASQTVTVSMTGTNDLASISGSSTANLTEGSSASDLDAAGTLTVSDADTGQSRFQVVTATQGANSYGAFAMDSMGSWTYTANSAHNEFASGQVYTDSIVFQSVDGTASQTVTVSMTG
ncbi:MAG: hypothetical protein EBY93_05585, partial [Actinobacteria bacterium]|nr:hypothetical protein [Actinomycetota bacterium]